MNQPPQNRTQLQPNTPFAIYSSATVQQVLPGPGVRLIAANITVRPSLGMGRAVANPGILTLLLWSSALMKISSRTLTESPTSTSGTFCVKSSNESSTVTPDGEPAPPAMSSQRCVAVPPQNPIGN